MNRIKFVIPNTKSILAAVITSGLLALGTQTASAQAITVTTPFAFSAGSQLYPAGTYQFTVKYESSLLSIRNVNGGGEKFFMVRPEVSKPLRPHSGLIFHNADGSNNLQAVRVPGTDRVAELTQQEAVSNKSKNHISLAATKMSTKKATVGNQNAPVQ
jgi:hypothetical protein